MEQLDDKMTAYYDSLPESALQEDYAWGAVGEAGLAAITEEYDLRSRVFSVKKTSSGS